MALALTAAGFLVAGYFFGMSAGLKKQRQPEVKAEIIIGAIATLVGIIAFSMTAPLYN